jgi:WD40 repeat protein
MGNSCSNAAKSYAQDSSDDGYATERSLHEGAVLGVASYAVNKSLSCGDDNQLCLFDWSDSGETNHPLYFKGHDKAVNKAACADGYVWSVSRDLTLRQWRADSAELVQTISQTHELNVSAVSIEHGGKRVFTGSRDYHVKGWDVETGLCTSTFSCPRNIVTALDFDQKHNPHLLYQGSEDLCIRAWDTRSSQGNVPARHLSGYVYFPLCLALHPDGNTLASGCKGFNSVGCEVKLWDLRQTAAPLTEFRGHTQDVTGCRFSPDGKDLVSVSKDGIVFAWNTAQSDAESPVAQLSTGRIYSSLAVLDGEEKGTFVSGAFDGSISRVRLLSGNMRVDKMTAPGFFAE